MNVGFDNFIATFVNTLKTLSNAVYGVKHFALVKLLNFAFLTKDHAFIVQNGYLRMRVLSDH